MTSFPRALRRRLAAALIAAAAATPAAAISPLDIHGPEDLPDGPGRDDVFYRCSVCHSFNLVARQRLGRSLWNDTITLMVERHGMPEPDEALRELLLGYLSQAFAPEEGPRGWTNPFLRR